MKAILIPLLLGFGVAFAVVIGQRMTTDSMAVVLGVAVGAAASVPVSLVIVWLVRRGERCAVGSVPQNTPERATGHQWASSDAGARVGPALAVYGHSTRAFADADLLRHYTDRGHDGPMIDGQWRSYAYEVPTKTRRYRRHPLGSASANAPIVETMTPARAPDMRADVGVPIGQSLFSALVAGLVAAVIAWRLGGDVLLWAIVGAVGGLAVAWLAALGLARSLVWRIERFIGDDIDGDGVEGAPDPAHVMLENPNQARETAGRIAGEHAGTIRTAELLSFLTRCSVIGTSEGKLGIGTSPQARAKYAALRDTLIQLGIGQWRDENRRAAGWLLKMTPAQAAPIIARHVRELRAG